MWSSLRHPNVLPLLGATMTGAQFTMVSEWMGNGNINEFVKAYPDADRLGLVSFPLKVLLSHSLLITTRPVQLRDVGRGLEYLHGQGMIHGDLKGVCLRTCCRFVGCWLTFARL